MLGRSNAAGTTGDAFFFFPHLKSCTFSCCLNCPFMEDKYSHCSAMRGWKEWSRPWAEIDPVRPGDWVPLTPPMTQMKNRGALRRMKMLKTGKSRKPASRGPMLPSGSPLTSNTPISTRGSVICRRYFLMPRSQLLLLPVMSQANMLYCHLAQYIPMNLWSENKKQNEAEDNKTLINWILLLCQLA